MSIMVNLEVILSKLKIICKYLAEIIGMTTANLSVLNLGKEKLFDSQIFRQSRKL